MGIKETSYVFSKVLNFLLIIMTIIGFFLLDFIQKPFLWIGIFIILLILFWLVIYAYLKRKIKKVIEKGNVKITIEKGNIFDEKGLKVIPVDEELTLEVDNIKVSSNTLHGKLLNLYNIEQENLKPVDGVYIYKEDYILFPFVKIIDNKAKIENKKEYIDKIYNLLSAIDSIENGRIIILPVIGDGATRLTFTKENRKYELINLIIDIIDLYEFQKKVEIKIKIFDKKFEYFSIK